MKLLGLHKYTPPAASSSIRTSTPIVMPTMDPMDRLAGAGAACGAVESLAGGKRWQDGMGRVEHKFVILFPYPFPYNLHSHRKCTLESKIDMPHNTVSKKDYRVNVV